MGTLQLQPKGVVGFGEIALDVKEVLPDIPNILLHRGSWSLEAPKGFDEEHLEQILVALDLQACSRNGRNGNSL